MSKFSFISLRRTIFSIGFFIFGPVYHRTGPVYRSNRSVYRSGPIEPRDLNSNLSSPGFRPVPDRTGPVNRYRTSPVRFGRSVRLTLTAGDLVSHGPLVFVYRDKVGLLFLNPQDFMHWFHHFTWVWMLMAIKKFSICLLSIFDNLCFIALFLIIVFPLRLKKERYCLKNKRYWELQCFLLCHPLYLLFQFGSAHPY
jgi:hypothetical protein